MERRREQRNTGIKTKDGRGEGGEGTDEVWRRRRVIDELWPND